MHKHQDKVKKLASVGWDPHSNQLVDDWDLIVDCLVVYKAQFGDLRIPAKFVVPDMAPWPRMARGMKIGVRVAAIRSAGRYIKENPARKARLDALGFEYRIRDSTPRGAADDEKFHVLCRALECYKERVDPTFNNLPTKYVVPETEDWPEEVRGVKLGYLVCCNACKKGMVSWYLLMWLILDLFLSICFVSVFSSVLQGCVRLILFSLCLIFTC